MTEKRKEKFKCLTESLCKTFAMLQAMYMETHS